MTRRRPGYAAAVVAILTLLQGCGGSNSVSFCFGDVLFCNNVFEPIADAGSNQTSASGDTVTLDGSASRSNGGSIESFSWTQTAGPVVTLDGADTSSPSFVAPEVADVAELTFRLTVVNTGGRADSDSTTVAVEPRAAAAIATALELLDGSLRPVGVDAPPGECASATTDLVPAVASAQRGLWLAARSLAFAKHLDPTDRGEFLDAARALAAQRDDVRRDAAGQIESLGFALLGALAQDVDPALDEAIATQQRDAAVPDDPGAFIDGRAEVATDARGEITIALVPDPTRSDEHAIAQLLDMRAECVDAARALSITASGLRVIAAAHNAGE